VKAIFVNLKDGRQLPFQTPKALTEEDEFHLGNFIRDGGGFLPFSDGTQLWVDAREVLTAYVVPLVDGQKIALRV
jgi:hypothetical protein